MAEDQKMDWRIGPFVVDLVSQEIFDRWHVIGITAGLNSDAQIASFLIKQYEKTWCMRCKMQLTMYCSQCDLQNHPYSDHGRETSQMQVQEPGYDQQRDDAERNQSLHVQHAPVENTNSTSTGQEQASNMVTAPLPPASDAHVAKSASRVMSTAAQGSDNSMLSSSAPDNSDLSQGNLTVSGEAPDEVGKKVVESPQKSARQSSHAQKKRKSGEKHARKCKKLKQVVNDSDTEQYTCRECGDNFDSMCTYRKHMKTHGINKPFECSKCSEMFTTKGHMKLHVCLERKHTVSGDSAKPYGCNQCSFTCSLKSNLVKHLRAHTGIRPKFLCEICNTPFSLKQTYKSHMLTHSTDRPFHCTVCGQTFKLPTCLNKHRKKHTEVKPYMCTECGLAFKLRDYLRQHMRTHTGERPFVCDVCGAGFAQKGSLNSHMKTHKSDK